MQQDEITVINVVFAHMTHKQRNTSAPPLPPVWRLRYIRCPQTSRRPTTEEGLSIRRDASQSRKRCVAQPTPTGSWKFGLCIFFFSYNPETFLWPKAFLRKSVEFRHKFMFSFMKYWERSGGADPNACEFPRPKKQTTRKLAEWDTSKS